MVTEISHVFEQVIPSESVQWEGVKLEGMFVLCNASDVF